MSNSYYVYALLRVGGEPFYIGKGQGSRWNCHERPSSRRTNSYKAHIIDQLLATIGEVPKIKLAENLTDEQAKDLEVVLIQLIGRYPNGPLVNATRGGDGGDVSAEAREKQRQARIRAWTDPQSRERTIDGFRRRYTKPLERERTGEQSRARWRDPEMRALMTDAQYRPDVIEKKRLARLAVVYSDAARQNMGAGQARRFSNEEERTRISKLQRDGWTESKRAKFSEMRRSACKEAPRHWITDGVIDSLVLTTSPIPDGWRRGRKPRSTWKWRDRPEARS